MKREPRKPMTRDERIADVRDALIHATNYDWMFVAMRTPPEIREKAILCAVRRAAIHLTEILEGLPACANDRRARLRELGLKVNEPSPELLEMERDIEAKVTVKKDASAATAGPRS